MIHKHFLLVFIFLFTLTVNFSCTQTTPPVNPNATKEVKELLSMLHSVSGKYTISGQHNYREILSRCTDTNTVITGKTPLVWGADLSSWRGIEYDIILVEAVKRYKQGHIITLMCHQPVPLSEKERLEWREKRRNNRGNPNQTQMPNSWYKMPEEEWLQIVTPGTEKHEQWLVDIDRMAEVLKVLQEKNIPVLWRPYHEMNGMWFWWGNRRGENGFSKLWKMMYDRYTNYHKLNNLIWVWNANAPRDWENDEAYEYELFYPGNGYVDVLAADVYKNDFKQSHHDQLLELGKGKVIALGEVGVVPTPEILTQQPRWAWFMTWAGFNSNPDHNTPEHLSALYNDTRVVSIENRDLIPLERYSQKTERATLEKIEPLAEIKAAPVVSNASPEAVKLLSFLHSIKGKYTIAGQHDYPAEMSRYADYTRHIFGKTPLLWGCDFTWGATHRYREQMVQEAIKRYNDGYIVTLMWHANPPVKARLNNKDHEVGFDWDRNEEVRYISWYKMPEEEWLSVVTPGTVEHKVWLDDVDSVAGYLKKLQAANVPVLFRPYHEMNGMWFWWGNRRGENGFTKLWKMMYDRMVNYHKLNNILWVWNANAPRDRENDEAYDYELFYPGNDYVDVLAADVYRNDYKQSHHDQLVKLGGESKVIALGEVGNIPTPEILAQQPQWVWVMIWAYFNTVSALEYNSFDGVKTFHNDPHIVTKENLESLGISFK